jgi:hypothetical protein
MNIYTIAGAFGALALLVVIVATLEWLECRARERRWQKASNSFMWNDTRTALTDAPVARQMWGKGPTR